MELDSGNGFPLITRGVLVLLWCFRLCAVISSVAVDAVLLLRPAAVLKCNR
jgi:hypothetical protein